MVTGCLLFNLCFSRLELGNTSGGSAGWSGKGIFADPGWEVKDSSLRMQGSGMMCRVPIIAEMTSAQRH